MRRIVLALFTLFALTFGVTSAASAQADLGNDGIDTNCTNEYFTSTAQARQYFADDGGSINRNVDDLDRDGDGTACDQGIRDVGGNGSLFPGGGGNDGTSGNDGTTGGGGGDTDTDNGTDTGTTDGGTTLPTVGSGTTLSTSDSNMMLVTAFGSVAAVLGLAALRLRQQS